MVVFEFIKHYYNPSCESYTYYYEVLQHHIQYLTFKRSRDIDILDLNVLTHDLLFAFFDHPLHDEIKVLHDLFIFLGNDHFNPLADCKSTAIMMNWTIGDLSHRNREKYFCDIPITLNKLRSSAKITTYQRGFDPLMV